MNNYFSFDHVHLVDLSHSYSSETIYWPTEEGFKLEKEFDGMTEKGYYYSANKFFSPEHGGTHMDAPIHFAKNGKTVDQIPLDQLIGQAIVIDVFKDTLKNPDYQVSIQDFANWESSYGKIPEGAIVLLHTDAAKWLVENRKINAIGLDTQSIDYGKSEFFETPRILCTKNIPFFENVANLDQLPSTGAYVIALPMKIEGGSGAPLRIIAIIPTKV